MKPMQVNINPSATEPGAYWVSIYQDGQVLKPISYCNDRLALSDWLLFTLRAEEKKS